MQPALKRLTMILCLIAFLPASARISAAAACDTLRAGTVTWVTLNDEGGIDRQVSAYPSGTTAIAPLFEYSCAPKNTTIVTVFSHDGETVLTDKEALRPSERAESYSYPLRNEDNTALENGEWKVAFYKDKTLLTSGTVQVGGATAASNAVTVRGTVRDGNTRKPIKAALVAVIKPGMSVSAFLESGRETDLLASGTTDSLGQFSLNRPLTRDIIYSLLIVAKGYRPIGRDDFKLGGDDPDPLDMDILMMK
jgi:hypothetical protein